MFWCGWPLLEFHLYWMETLSSSHTVPKNSSLANLCVCIVWRSRCGRWVHFCTDCVMGKKKKKGYFFWLKCSSHCLLCVFLSCLSLTVEEKNRIKTTFIETISFEHKIIALRSYLCINYHFLEREILTLWILLYGVLHTNQAWESTPWSGFWIGPHDVKAMVIKSHQLDNLICLSVSNQRVDNG